MRIGWKLLAQNAHRLIDGLLRPILAVAMLLVVGSQPASALEPIVIGDDQEKIEITLLGELYEGRGDQLELETAAGADGIVGRIAVRALTEGTNPNWIAFALTNPTNNRIERWITTERYNIIGSGITWPDLDTAHIAQVTPSMGFRPKRIDSDSADIFPIELGPRETITYVVELQSQKFPQLYLWKARAYEKNLRSSTLFNGIMLGITGLLAVFLTAVFVANHKAIFPVTAIIAWSVAAYLCVDFGFWHKLFRLSPEDNALYRAATEASIALSVVIFLYTFLRLSLWHNWIRIGFLLWVLGQGSLVALAVVDANLASGLARLSFVPIAGIGTLLILYLAVHGQDRALSLVPSWILFMVWLFGAGVTVLGQLSGDIVASALVSGLVLIVLLLGFTVTQFAFRTGEPSYGGAPPSQLQLRSMAVDGASASVWEWNARRDEINVSENIDVALGLPPGTLSGRVDDWMEHLHPADKERFRLILWSLREQNEGEIHLDFRMRRADSSYLWYELRAHSVALSQYRNLRCVGLLREITGQKRSQERLMHDAVHDSLTGLPNRELFMDRLASAVIRAREERGTHPTVLFIDIDRFKNVNSSLGLVVGDSMLLTVARRLSRHLSPLDTLARVGGDQFAILVAAETEPRQIGLLAERVRRSLRSPMKISGKEVILTGSIGIAIYDGKQASPADILRESEIAMYRAKRFGTDRVEIFKPSMREDGDDRLTKESDLRRAIDRRQLTVLYQPIVRLEDEEIAGFEALLRWDHPKLGRLNPDDFIPIAEEAGIIFDIGAYVLDNAMRQAVAWQKALPRPESPLYVSVNVSSRELFRQDLIQDVRQVMRREASPPGTLRLEITESLVMENPEAGLEILEWLKGAGTHLSMDDFGTGYSSLSYLQRFPFDTIKIDKSLVRDTSDEGAGPVIVRSIVALSHELGKDVVAEGIETLEDTVFLRSIGCDFAQGYYFGEPMSESDVLKLLAAIAKKQQSEGKSKQQRKRKQPPQQKSLPDPKKKRPPDPQTQRQRPPGAQKAPTAHPKAGGGAPQQVRRDQVPPKSAAPVKREASAPTPGAAPTRPAQPQNEQQRRGAERDAKNEKPRNVKPKSPSSVA